MDENGPRKGVNRSVSLHAADTIGKPDSAHHASTAAPTTIATRNRRTAIAFITGSPLTQAKRLMTCGSSSQARMVKLSHPRLRRILIFGKDHPTKSSHGALLRRERHRSSLPLCWKHVHVGSVGYRMINAL